MTERGPRHLTPNEQRQLVIMRASGLTDSNIARLIKLRDQVHRKEVDELTPEYYRLAFVRYLYKENRVSDWIPGPTS